MIGQGRAAPPPATASVPKAKSGSQRGVFATGMAVPNSLPPPPPPPGGTAAAPTSAASFLASLGPAPSPVPSPAPFSSVSAAPVPAPLPSPTQSSQPPPSPRTMTVSGGFLSGPVRPSQQQANGGSQLTMSDKRNPLYGDGPLALPASPSAPAHQSYSGKVDLDPAANNTIGRKALQPNPGGGAKVMSHAEIQAMLGKPSDSTPNPGGGAKVMSHAEIQAMLASKSSASSESASEDAAIRVNNWAWSHARPKKNEVLVAYFLHNNQRYTRPVPVTMNAADVKKNLLAVVNDPRLNPANLILKIDVIDFYIQNETTPMHRIPLFQVCNKAYVSPVLQLVERSGEVPESPELKQQIAQELRRNTDIAALIGDSMGEFLAYEDEEIDVFRQKMLKRIVKWRSAVQHSNMAECFPEYYLGEPLLPNLPQTFAITVYTPEKSNETKKESMAKNLMCSITETVNEIRAKAFKKFVLSAQQSVTAGKTAEDYWLKVTGQASFMFGDRKVLDYDYIRVCLSKGRKIELTMVEHAILEATVQQEDYSISLVERLLLSTPEPPMPDPFDYEHPPERVEKYRPFNIQTISGHLKIKISGVENVPPPPKEADGPNVIFVMCELVYSGARLCPPVYSLPKAYNANIRWAEWLPFEFAIRNIPHGSRICFTLFRRPTTNARLNTEPLPQDINEKDTALGWVNAGLVNHKRLLRAGMDSFRLWPDARANFIGTCVENLNRGDVPVLFVEFETLKHPIAYPAESTPTAPPTTKLSIPIEWDRKVEDMISKDLAPEMVPEINKLLWLWRWQLMSKPHSLPKLLLAVPWHDFRSVQEAQALLALWPPISPVQALELLDAQFSDAAVRKYAVRRLKTLEDHEVEDYLLQLTQVLKYESNHDSALARFLLKRGLRSKKRVGHSLFWHLKAEMHVPEIAERYGLLLEAYLRGCGENSRQELLKENEAITKLLTVANKIKPPQVAPTRKELLQAELGKTRLPEKFVLPLDPKLECRGLILERCKNMDSKKLPLWLEFLNAETIGNKISVIFKAGDDLRQDALTLQLIRLMDKIWKKAGMDMRLQPYGAVSTGDQIGMIEIVLDANTTANINKEASGAMAVFYKDTLTQWLKKQNASDAAFAKAQETFLYSCAGYCVATYVLGIGDRHNDNIMLTKYGHLFHIDFGHFLGNFKSKFGVKRERAPFIFTAQFCHVLGGKKSELFKKFVQTACQAYNILRRHANLFRNLLKMMLSTGIPELTKEEDISWLRDHFCLDSNDQQAAELFTQEINTALNTKTVVINDVVHILAHPDKKKKDKK